MTRLTGGFLSARSSSPPGVHLRPKSVLSDSVDIHPHSEGRSGESDSSCQARRFPVAFAAAVAVHRGLPARAPRRVAGWLLVGIGAIMAVVHMVTHLGRLHLLGYQDLLVGYPMAGVLVLGGFLLVGSTAKA